MNLDTEKLFEMSSFAINRARSAGMDGSYIKAELDHVFSTRFAKSVIHQNFTDYETKLEITLINGQRQVTVSTNSLEVSAISWAVDRGIKFVKHLPDDPEFPGILTEPQKYPKLQLNDPMARNLTPSDIADKIISAINAGHAFSSNVKDVSGNLNLRNGVTLYISSEDLEYQASVTGMTSTINIMADDGTGESRSQNSFGNRRFSELPFEIEAEEVAKRAVMGLRAETIEPKEYPVILDYQAAADQMFFLGMALSARNILDHQSFLQDKMGEQVFAKSLKIVNDPHESSFLAAYALDAEGVASQKYMLINQGVVENFAHDRKTAKKMGTASNGCSFILFGEFLPLPGALNIQGGHRTREQLIEDLDEGLIVTNLHYSNYIDRTRGTTTGMTKDGLFIVKNGEITGAAKNMRFTDSIPKMFSNVEVSKETLQVLPFWGLILDKTLITPTMKIASMNFSSKTTH
ncbi:MAG: TldD/PmbA family protein [Promethearchaeota archaeon]